MFEFFHLDDFLVGGTVIASVVLFSLFLQSKIKRYVGKETLESFHEVGGYYMSAVGTLYAVILGLVVVDASNRFNDARVFVETEAMSLVEVYVFSEKMPEPQRTQIRALIKSYAHEVLTTGWDRMSHSERDQEGLLLFKDLMEQVRDIEPVTENQKALYQTILSSFVKAGESRRGRLNYDEYNIPRVEWFSLIVGGIIAIAFTMFFAMEHLLAQSLMTGMVAFVVSLNLYTAYLFNTPYSGDLQISKDPFVVLHKVTNDDYTTSRPPIDK